MSSKASGSRGSDAPRLQNGSCCSSDGGGSGSADTGPPLVPLTLTPSKTGPLCEDRETDHLLRVVSGSCRDANGLLQSPSPPSSPLHDDDEDRGGGKGASGCLDWKTWLSMRGRIRYAVLLYVVLCITLTRSNEISFSFTAICMTANHTENHNSQHIGLTHDQTSYILAAGGLGAFFAVLPLVGFLHRYGARSIFTVMLIVSGIATICLSPLALVSPLYMLPGRILQGFALATVMPMVGTVSAAWSPQSELGIFTTLLSSAGQFCQILTNPLAAVLCVNYGWSSIFTVHGLMAIAAAAGFYYLYRNSPHDHPCVGTQEAALIGQKPRPHLQIPYMAIATSPAVWGVWIAFLGNAMGFQLIVQFMPIFLNRVLRSSIRRTGALAIVPPICQLVVKIVAGWLSDHIRWPEKRKLRVFNTIAQVGCGVCLVPIGFLEPGEDVVAILFFSASISFLGIISCGSMKSANLIARPFAHFVMAIVQMIVCATMLLVPFLVSVVAPDNTIKQWRSVFMIVFCILFLTNAAFCYLCGAELEPWAVVPTSPKKEKQLLF